MKYIIINTNEGFIVAKKCEPAIISDYHIVATFPSYEAATDYIIWQNTRPTIKSAL